jgi:putative nucleotidyltransferase with HDIG domain
VSQREKIITTIRSVPSLPVSAAMISNLLRDPDVDFSKVAGAIEFDPGLAANVLKIANSAYFGGPKSIGSIRLAIMRLGINRIYNLVMASVVAPLARQPIKGYDLSPGALWEHSVATAVGADQLAMVLGLKTPEYTFTAALLHDIGKIVLGTFVEIDAKPIMDMAFEEGLSFEDAERRVLGIDHAEVGALLLQQWNLPKGIVDAVRWHQRPDDYDGDRLIVDIIHVADALSMMGGMGTGSDGLHYRISEAVVERLGLNVRLAETVACRVLAGLEELKALFSIDPRR